MSIIKGMRRPNRSPSHPKMNAPSGRIIRVMVMAKVTSGMVRPKSCATGTKTKVRRKKSSASRVHPRKQAMKVLRCTRFSDLKSRTASTPSQLNVFSDEVETSHREEPRIRPHTRARGDRYRGCSGACVKHGELRGGRYNPADKIWEPQRRDQSQVKTLRSIPH